MYIPSGIYNSCLDKLHKLLVTAIRQLSTVVKPSHGSEANEFLLIVLAYVVQDSSSNSHQCVGVGVVLWALAALVPAAAAAAAACINYHNNKLRIIKIVSYFVSIN